MNQITFQAVKDSAVNPVVNIGQRAQTPDGREWVYVKAAEAISANQAVVPDAVVAVDTVSSSTDGLGRIVYITEASAGWTVGAFAEGWVYVDDGTGIGQAGRIKTNTTDTLELYPEFAFATALSVTDSDITIRQPFNVDKSAITSKVQGCVGIAQIAIASGSYGWVLTRGVGTVLAGDTLVVGASFVTGDDTEGSVVVGTTAKGAYDEQSLGYALVANSAADKATLVWVELDA
jgi:hypothetical protein